ncbi:MAG: HlyD family efflux transporter periplasmic adaptor subunit [Thermoanaerobaculia bacterium]
MDRELTPDEHRRRRRRTALRIGLVAVSAAIALLAAARLLRPSATRSELRFATVELGTLVASIPAQGRLAPAFEEQLLAPVEGRVVRVLKRPGDTIHRDEAILELDLAAAQSDLARLDDRVARARHLQRQLELDSGREVAEIERRLAEAELDLEAAGVVLAQRTRLAADGLISEGERLAAEVVRKKAELVVGELRGAVLAVRAARDERLGGGTLDLAIVEKERVELSRKLTVATTRSDREGIVTYVLADEGALVRPGDVVARVADLGAFRLEATAAELHAPRLAPGLAVSFEAAPGERLSGRIARVDPTLAEASVKFTALLDRPDHPALRNALRVDVDVVLEERPGVLKVQRPAFASAGARQQIFVLSGARLVRRSATFGLAGRNEIEILSGLAEGDRIVVSDTSSFAHFERLDLN